MNKKIRFAVVLSGCGRGDGSEIHEAVSLLLSIDQQGGEYACFAPDIWQSQVFNHYTDSPEDEKRSVLAESARIARGNIRPMEEFEPKDFDAIVFPGGVGAITNLCDCAYVSSEHSKVNPEVEKAIVQSYNKGLAIGAMCIAPVLIARVLGKHHIEVTIGDAQNVAQKIESFGAKHIVENSTGVCVDKKNKIVTTPAYMLANSPKEVYQGAYEMIKSIIGLAK